MAGIRSVGLNQTYTTLTSAYNAAVNDDTLLISPGVYSETVSSTKRLHWIGAGHDRVIIYGRLILNAGSDGTRIEGLYAIGGYFNAGIVQLAAGIDLIEIKRCRIRNTYATATYEAYGIQRTASLGGRLTLESCILEQPFNGSTWGAHLDLNGDVVTIKNTIFCNYGNDNSQNIRRRAFRNLPQSLSVENCVFTNFSLIFDLAITPPIRFHNNVVHDWAGSPSWASFSLDGLDFAFNASTSIAPPGTDGILLVGDPFVEYDEGVNYVYGVSDLHLAAGSPCFDAGDPAVLDLDNSRSDMGIYGGPTPFVEYGAPNYPFAVDLTIPTSMTAGQQLPIQAAGRIGAGY